MNRKGFTLIELLVVVMMVGILTSVALPQYRKAMKRARTAEVLQMLPALYEARERYIETMRHAEGVDGTEHILRLIREAANA